MSSFHSLGAVPFSMAVPIFLLGVYDCNNKPNITTIAWGGICASQPPALAISVRRTRWAHAALLERKAFTISVPKRSQVIQADFAGLHSGKSVDKFASLGLTPIAAEHVDAPYIKECPLVIELALIHTLDLGSHTQCIGEIMDVKVDAACMRPDGMPDPEKIDPLIFAPLVREYYGLGSFEGRAYSAGHAASPMAILS